MDQQPTQLPPAGPPPPSLPSPPPQQAATAESMARVVYILYLVSLVTGVTALVGVILAYVNRDGAPPGLDTHYRYIIRTFWIGILYSFVGLLLAAVVVGVAVWAFTAVWLAVRCAKGLKYLGQQQPIPEPGTWLW